MLKWNVRTANVIPMPDAFVEAKCMVERIFLFFCIFIIELIFNKIFFLKIWFLGLKVSSC